MARLDDIKSSDGTRIAVYQWEPAEDATADILLCHGLAEHMGRYEHVAAALTARGWRVTGVELRGHGQSDGKRGHVEKWSDYVDDLRAAAALIDGPYAILAHSMGSLVTLDHLRTHDRVLAAALGAPLLEAGVPVPAWKTYGARILNWIVPRLSMENEIPSDWICSDPAVVEAYVADPLVFSTVTPRWFIQMTRAAARVLDRKSTYNLPLYVFWGEGDQIVATNRVAEFATQVHAATRPWPGQRHECLNETDKEAVLAELITWLEPHLKAAAVSA